jgi:hypothetical protein
MKKPNISKARKLLPVVAGAALGAWGAVPAAHGDFIISMSAGKVVGFDTVYEVFAQNTGTGQDSTGSKLTGFNFTVTTASHDLIIDTAADIDGDGTNDADVSGASDKTNGSPTPQFNAATGTFMGLPSSATGKTVATSSEVVNDVFINSQTSYYNPTTPTQAVWHSLNNNVTSAIDTNFTHGTVSSLQMEASATGSGVTDTSAVPFANIVVLTGTEFTVQGTLTGNTGTPFTIPNTVVGISNSGPTLSVTGTVPGSSTSVGSITLTGGSGSYGAQSTGNIVSGAQTTGYLMVHGFSPTSDGEIYALGVDANGSPATGATLTSIIIDMNAALQLADGSTATVTTVAPAVGALFPFANIELNLPNGPSPSSASPAILAYDFSTYTTNGAITVTDIGVVPEPASLGMLVLGGFGMLGRRRKKILN